MKITLGPPARTTVGATSTTTVPIPSRQDEHRRPRVLLVNKADVAATENKSSVAVHQVNDRLPRCERQAHPQSTRALCNAEQTALQTEYHHNHARRAAPIQSLAQEYVHRTCLHHSAQYTMAKVTSQPHGDQVSTHMLN